MLPYMLHKLYFGNDFIAKTYRLHSDDISIFWTLDISLEYLIIFNTVSCSDASEEV